MDELNHFAISKALGSRIKAVANVGFGGFSAIATAEEFKKAMRDASPARVGRFRL